MWYYGVIMDGMIGSGLEYCDIVAERTQGGFGIDTTRDHRRREGGKERGREGEGEGERE